MAIYCSVSIIILTYVICRKQFNIVQDDDTDWIDVDDEIAHAPDVDTIPETSQSFHRHCSNTATPLQM